MRLLHSQTFELLEFPESLVPYYAILSHTWGDEEVTLQNLDDRASAKKKAGWKKIRYCGDQAKADGWEYFWVDTCCIDKKSSAELSEAINSMFAWYKNAKTCYVYLEDVSVLNSHGKEANLTAERWGDAFMKSRWLTRGWTLQELIAPAEVMFYSAEWELLGSKAQHLEIISEATRIDPDALKPETRMECFSIAQRMSWAAGRKTTRVEDRAYSLMGIFDVNMPMLYGEGMKAFRRLQEEIIKTSNDQSILAWSYPMVTSQSQSFILAGSPDYFANAAHIWPRNLWSPSPTFALSNTGLAIQLFLSPLEGGGFEAYLACTTGEGFCNAPCFLVSPARMQTSVKTTNFDQPQIYFRISSVYSNPEQRTKPGSYTNIILAAGSSTSGSLMEKIISREIFPGNMFLIRSNQLSEPYEWYPQDAWNPRTRLFSVQFRADSDSLVLGAIAFQPPELYTGTSSQMGIAVRILEFAYQEEPIQTQLFYYDKVQISLKEICGMSPKGPYEPGVVLASAPLGPLSAPSGKASSGHFSSLEIPIAGHIIHIGARVTSVIGLRAAAILLSWVIDFELEILLNGQPKSRVEDI